MHGGRENRVGDVRVVVGIGLIINTSTISESWDLFPRTAPFPFRLEFGLALGLGFGCGLLLALRRLVPGYRSGKFNAMEDGQRAERDWKLE